MGDQWLELGLMVVLALTCGGMGLVAGKYLNATGGCCGGGGHSHHDAPPPDPLRRQWDERPKLVLAPYVPPSDMQPVDRSEVQPVLNEGSRSEAPGGDAATP